MLPYSPYLAFLAGLVLVLIPIATTWPGLNLPAWVGLGLALLSAAAAYLLQKMAPGDDVHKDSELPLPPPPAPTLREIADELERRRRERVAERLREVANDG
jgi:hypothetical protein